ncbi:hypothetical protein SUGI_0345390 [Cryptomeria japonica]|nr:hypothetical protein SUGI_0345390 [Cryptomeria japonica]
MEGFTGDGGQSVPLARWRSNFSRRFQYYLDKSTPHPLRRWLGTSVAAIIYILRVYYVQGFYIVSYGLGIYVLNLLIGFLSPQVDPEIEGMDGVSLPTKGSDEFRPFVRRLPEFKFWYSITKAFCIAFLMTFFSENEDIRERNQLVTSSTYGSIQLGRGLTISFVDYTRIGLLVERSQVFSRKIDV